VFAAFRWLAIALAATSCGQPSAKPLGEPAARSQLDGHKGRDVAAAVSSEPASEPLVASFSDKLREISLHFGADLTPNRVASILGSSVGSDAPGRWSIKLEHESEAIMKAEGAGAQVSWLAFMLSATPRSEVIRLNLQRLDD
jgi:hypothetical protein